MTPSEFNVFQRLTFAVERLVHGPTLGQPGEKLSPTGFEALTMAVGGKRSPGDDSLTDAIGRVADSNNLIAESLNNIADAIISRQRRRA